MRSNIFSLSILNLLRPALITAAALAVYVLLMLTLYPLLIRFPDLAQWINTSLQQNDLFAALVVTVKDPVGYLNFTAFSLVVPLLVSIFAVLAGQESLNGSESKAAIELLLARPVQRTRMILEKFASLALILFLICAAIWLVIALRSGPSSLWVDPWRLAQAMLALTLLSFGYAGMGLAAASLLRSSASSRIAAAVLVAVPFAIFLVEGLEGTTGSLKYFSPFYYAAGTNPLAAGLQMAPVLLLLGLAGASLALAAAAFERRDL